MNTEFASVLDIIEGSVVSPIPLEVIPNNMGINLNSVDCIGWQKTKDGQLVNLTIYFKPAL